jgi:hypothetical protein
MSRNEPIYYDLQPCCEAALPVAGATPRTLPKEMHKITNFPIISTLEDLQGEKCVKEDLESFLDGLPPRLPINIEHDMGRATTGYIENFRVVPVPGADGEWMLIGDHFLSEMPLEDSPLKGMSFSFTKAVSKNTPDAEEFHLYLPFPQYRDEVLMDRLHRVDVPLALGRWHKKEVSPEAVGLIIGVITLVVGPEWTRIYEERIRPKLIRLIDHVRDEGGVAYDYHQLVKTEQGDTIRIIFVSDHSDWSASLRPDRISLGMDVAMQFLQSSDIATCKPVAQVRLKYSPDLGCYDVIFVQYQDGEHVTMG